MLDCRPVLPHAAHDDHRTHPQIWKRLLYQPVTLQDLAGVDDAAAADIGFVGRREESYQAHTFTVKDTSGATRLLVPGGASLHVNDANADEFVARALHARTHEFDVQVNAIRQGLSSVVPLQALALHSWRDLAVTVGGEPEIDWRVLKSHCSVQYVLVLVLVLISFGVACVHLCFSQLVSCCPLLCFLQPR